MLTSTRLHSSRNLLHGIYWASVIQQTFMVVCTQHDLNSIHSANWAQIHNWGIDFSYTWPRTLAQHRWTYTNYLDCTASIGYQTWRRLDMNGRFLFSDVDTRFKTKTTLMDWSEVNTDSTNKSLIIASPSCTSECMNIVTYPEFLWTFHLTMSNIQDP